MVVFIVLLVIPTLVFSLLHKVYQKLFVTPTDLKNKIVLVTGASSGLGEACAKLFSDHGCKVVLCARNEEQLLRVKKEINCDESIEWPLICKMDVTKPTDIDTCVSKLNSKGHTIDIIISNAGMSQRGSVADTLIEVHHKLMDVNYFGPVSLVKAFLPSMIDRRHGHIVSVGTIQSKIAIPFRSAYASSKHASQAFFDSLRAEVAKDDINVSVVNPGYIRTNLSLNALSGDGSKHGVLDATTASGMEPSYVANQILHCILYKTKEVNLVDFQSNVAMYIRTLLPSLYFKLMEKRAVSEYKKLKKST